MKPPSNSSKMEEKEEWWTKLTEISNWCLTIPTLTNCSLMKWTTALSPDNRKITNYNKMGKKPSKKICLTTSMNAWWRNKKSMEIRIFLWIRWPILCYMYSEKLELKWTALLRTLTTLMEAWMTFWKREDPSKNPTQMLLALDYKLNLIRISFRGAFVLWLRRIWRSNIFSTCPLS